MRRIGIKDPALEQNGYSILGVRLIEDPTLPSIPETVISLKGSQDELRNGGIPKGALAAAVTVPILVVGLLGKAVIPPL